MVEVLCVVVAALFPLWNRLSGGLAPYTERTTPQEYDSKFSTAARKEKKFAIWDSGRENGDHNLSSKNKYDS